MRAPLLAAAAWLVSAPATAQIELVATIGIAAEQIAVAGGHAYVAAGRTLTVLEIGNPAAATEIGRVVAPDRIYGLDAGEDRAYLAAGLEGMHIVDMSRGSPEVIGVYPTPGQAVDVAAAGRYAVVSNLMTGLEVVTLETPAAPRRVATAETPGYQRAVSTAAGLAFVIDQPSGVHLFDLRDPAAPVEVGVHAAGRVPARNVTIENGRAYVVYQRSGLIEIVDVATPGAPARLGAYEASGRPETVAVAGTTMVVPNRDAGLELVDVRDPAAPRVTAVYDTPGVAGDVAVAGDHLLVADGDRLLILRWR